MEVQRINSQTAFTSRNNPVKAAEYICDTGKVIIREAGAKDIVPAAKFIQKSQALSYRINNLYGSRENTREAREIYKSINKYQWMKDIKEYLIKMLQKPDGDSTLIVAVNDKNKVIGCATMESLDGIKTPIGIIENINLDYKYRFGEIGHHLLRTITETAQNRFKGVAVKHTGLSLQTSDPFVELGFKALAEKSPEAEILTTKYESLSKITPTWLLKKM